MSARPRYLPNVLAQAVTRVTFMASTVVVFVMCARHLSVAEFGEFAYVMAFMALTGLVADAGSPAILARELTIRKGDATAAVYFGNFILLRIAMAIAASALATVIALFLQRPDWTTLLLAAAVAPFGTARFFDPVFQVFDRPWRGIPIAVATSLVYVAASLMALYGTAEPIPYLIGVYGFASTIYLILAFYMSADVLLPKLNPDRRLLRQLLAMATPIAVSAIFSAVNGRIGTLLLGQLASPTDVGNFTAASKLIELGVAVAITLWAPLVPILTAAARSAGGLRRTAASLFEGVAVLGFPAVILLWCTAPWLLRHIFGVAYGAAGPIAGVLVWQLLAAPLTLIASAILLANGSIKFCYWIGGGGAAVNTLINFLLIPRLGAIGTAIGAVAAETVMLGTVLFYLFRNVGQIFSARIWLKILAFNALLVADVVYPAIGNPTINVVFAFLAYAVLVLTADLFPRRELLRILFRPAEEAT